MTTPSPFDPAITAAGGLTALGERLTPPVTGQAVYKWRKQGWCPPGRAKQIEALFGTDRLTLVKPSLRDAVS